MFKISIDGGCRESKLSAAACTIEYFFDDYISERDASKNYKKVKLVTLLDDCSPLMSELISLVLAFSLHSILNSKKPFISETTLYTDSQVIKDALESNLLNWEANNWKNKQNKKLLNKTLWQLALELKPEKLSIERDRNSKNVIKCHRACDWVLSSHKKFSTNTFLKKPSSSNKDPWFYVDKRSFFNTNFHLIEYEELRKHMTEFTNDVLRALEL